MWVYICICAYIYVYVRIFKTCYVFDTQSTSEFALSTFQMLSSHTQLMTTIPYLELWNSCSFLILKQSFQI